MTTPIGIPEIQIRAAYPPRFTDYPLETSMTDTHSLQHAVQAHASVLDLIGNTPLVEVSQLSPSPQVRLFAKLESQNPLVQSKIASPMQ